jgi:hypothetical protein
MSSFSGSTISFGDFAESEISSFSESSHSSVEFADEDPKAVTFGNFTKSESASLKTIPGAVVILDRRSQSAIPRASTPIDNGEWHTCASDEFPPLSPISGKKERKRKQKADAAGTSSILQKALTQSITLVKEKDMPSAPIEVPATPPPVMKAKQPDAPAPQKRKPFRKLTAVAKRLDFKDSPKKTPVKKTDPDGFTLVTRKRTVPPKPDKENRTPISTPVKQKHKANTPKKSPVKALVSGISELGRRVKVMMSPSKGKKPLALPAPPNLTESKNTPRKMPLTTTSKAGIRQFFADGTFEDWDDTPELLEAIRIATAPGHRGNVVRSSPETQTDPHADGSIRTSSSASDPARFLAKNKKGKTDFVFPPGQVCFRCGRHGHHIKRCPMIPSPVKSRLPVKAKSPVITISDSPVRTPDKEPTRPELLEYIMELRQNQMLCDGTIMTYLTAVKQGADALKAESFTQRTFYLFDPYNFESVRKASLKGKDYFMTKDGRLDEIFSADFLVWPCCIQLGGLSWHWVLVVADTRTYDVVVLDSIREELNHSHNDYVARTAVKFFNELERARPGGKKGMFKVLDTGKPFHFVGAKDVPQQVGGIDCGVFVCAFAEAFLKDGFDLEAYDAGLMRDRMIGVLNNLLRSITPLSPGKKTTIQSGAGDEPPSRAVLPESPPKSPAPANSKTGSTFAVPEPKTRIIHGTDPHYPKLQIERLMTSNVSLDHWPKDNPLVDIHDLEFTLPDGVPSSEALRQCLVAALQANGTEPHHRVLIFVTCPGNDVIKSNIVGVGQLTRVDEVLKNLDQVVNKIDQVNQSTRNAVYSGLFCLRIARAMMPRPAQQRGGGDGREFLDDQAEDDDTVSADEYFSFDDDSGDDIINDDESSDGEIPINPYLNQQLPDSFTRNVPENGILRSLVPDLPASKQSVSEKTGGFSKIDAADYRFLQPMGKGKYTQLTKIAKSFITLQANSSPVTRSVAFQLLRDYAQRQNSERQFPHELLGHPGRHVKQGLRALIEAVRKHPEGTGRSTSYFQDMVGHLREKAGVQESDDHDSEISKLGNVLHANGFRLIVHNADAEIIYNSPRERNQSIIQLIRAKQFFYPVTEPSANFCIFCVKIFEDGAHICPELCRFCQSDDCDGEADTSQIWQCSCRGIFKNQECLMKHREKCGSHCKICGRKKNQRHDCSKWQCRTCKQKATLGHKCYVVPKHQTHKYMRFCMYDLETCTKTMMIGDKMKQVHSPVMACATFTCGSCQQIDGETWSCEHDDEFEESVISNEEREQRRYADFMRSAEEQFMDDIDHINRDFNWRETAERSWLTVLKDMREFRAEKENKRPHFKCRTTKTFIGEDCVAQLLDCLIEWSSKSKSSKQMQFKHVVFAHCGGGFDHHFLFKEMMRRDMNKISLIKKGNKFINMSLKNPRMQFLDSYHFTPFALSKFKKAFGLSAAYKKNYWPHKLTPSDLRDLETFPSKQDYNYDRMGVKEKEEFDLWFDSQDRSGVFKTRELMEEYCLQDVKVLTEGIMTFRKIWMDDKSGDGGRSTDPFANKVTLTGAVMELFNACFLQTKLPVTPENGYNSWKKASAVGTVWLNEIERERGITIDREQYVGTDFSFDGVQYEDDENGVRRVIRVFDFLGCLFHMCPKCMPPSDIEVIRPNPDGLPEELRDGEVMGYKISPSRMRQDEERRELFCKSQGFAYEKIWECDYEDQVKERSDEDRRLNKQERWEVKREKEIGVIRHRKGMFGGRTETFKLHYKCKERESIRYRDVSGLYPHILMHYAFTDDHPVSVSQREDYIIRSLNSSNILKLVEEGLGKVNYFVRARVLPPRGLRLPFLPVRINKKLLFLNCRSCAEKHMKKADAQVYDLRECCHTVKQREFETYMHSIDLKIALQLGYEITELIGYEKYNVRNDIFTNFIKSRMYLKKKAETMDNFALRTLFKLQANGFWGFYGKKNDHVEVALVDVEGYLRMIHDKTIKITDMTPFGNSLRIEFKTKKLHRITATDTSLINATMVTSYARAELYQYLHAVGSDDLIYCDTDSIVHVIREDGDDPLKPFLNGWSNGPAPADLTDPFYDEHLNLAGLLEDEIEKEYGQGFKIMRWVSPGPKEYSYQIYPEVSDGTGEPYKVVSKCKGITISGEASDQLNFEYMLDLIHEGIGNPIPQGDQFKISKRSDITMDTFWKQPKFSFEKRVYFSLGDDLDSEIVTLPFGYVYDEDFEHGYSVTPPPHHSEKAAL